VARECNDIDLPALPRTVCVVLERPALPQARIEAMEILSSCGVFLLLSRSGATLTLDDHLRQISNTQQLIHAVTLLSSIYRFAHLVSTYHKHHNLPLIHPEVHLSCPSYSHDNRYQAIDTIVPFLALPHPSP
jgi:hypothetical protein